MTTIKRYSYLLEILGILAIFCTIGSFIAKWSYLLGAYSSSNFFTRMVAQEYAPFLTPSLLTKKFLLTDIAALLVDAIAPLLLIIAISCFIKLLHYYRASDNIFSTEALTRYKKVCRYALLWTLYNPINSMLLTLLLTLSNPPGHRFCQITLGSDDVAHAFIVGFFYFVALIMQEAATIKNEIDLTV
jgi:hypothetical protein